METAMDIPDEDLDIDKILDEIDQEGDAEENIIDGFVKNPSSSFKRNILYYYINTIY